MEIGTHPELITPEEDHERGNRLIILDFRILIIAQQCKLQLEWGKLWIGS